MRKLDLTKCLNLGCKKSIDFANNALNSAFSDINLAKCLLNSAKFSAPIQKAERTANAK